MSRIRSRTFCLMSTYPVVVTSPATTTRPVVRSVSTATRLCGSCSSIASSTESLIWSAILSGCPSVTDSEVNRRPVTVALQSLVPGPNDSGGVPGGGTRVSILQPERHLVPNDVRQRGLRAAWHLDDGAVRAEHDGLVLGAAEDGPAAHVVDDQQVAALAGQLRAAELEHRAGGVAG